jgi:hypothetical protein
MNGWMDGWMDESINKWMEEGVVVWKVDLIELRCMCFGSSTLSVRKSYRECNTLQCVGEWRAVVVGQSGGRAGEVM